jgi:F-type H+-transporting ATPase subunit b
VLGPSWVCAAEGGHAAGEAQGGSGALTLGIALLNLAVLVLVLRRYAGPLIQDFFFQRSEGIRKQLEHAQSRLRAAEAELEQLRGRLLGMDQEAERLVEEASQRAARERERALQRAEQTAQRIRDEAQRVAQRELARARSALRAEAAALATTLAAELLREQIRAEDHARLVEEFIARVENPAP